MNTFWKNSLMLIGLAYLTTLFSGNSSVYAADAFSDYFSRQPVYTDFLSRQTQAIANGQPDLCNTAEGATYDFWCTKWSAKPKVPANAYSNQIEKSAYTSLHQYRNTTLDIGFNISTVVNSPDSDGVLRPRYTSHFYKGFKNQFNPDNQITACGMGSTHPDGCENAAFHNQEVYDSLQNSGSTGGVALSIPSFRRTHIYPIINDFQYKSFKVYLPAGTSYIAGSFYFPKSIGKTSYAYAVRLGQPPKRSAPLTAEEYVSSNMDEDGTSNIENSISPHFKSFFNRLVEGDEVFLSHDGGGSIYFGSAFEMGKNKPMQKGAWLYFRQLQELPGNPYITAPQIIWHVNPKDKQLFLSEYKNMKWQANGDPVEEITPQDTILAPISLTLASNTSFYLTTSSLAIPGDIKQITAQNGKVTLSWKSQGMTSCTLNGQDIGLSGEKTITGLTTDGVVHYYKCTNTTTGRSASIYFTIFNNPFQDCSAPGSCGQGLPPTTSPGNPYVSSLSVSNLKVLTAWINKNITSKETVLTSAKYNIFIEGVITKFKNLSKTTKNKNVLTKINYLIFELQQIQDKIEDNDSSFLDDIFGN